MDATQAISDSILESDEEQNEVEAENKRGRPLAKLCILKNPHIPETELPLFLGNNVLGRDPSICTLLLPASSVSKQHATICMSVFRRRARHSEVDMEALVWDVGSMNGTRKGRLKLTPNVRYALSEGDSLVLADIPCQYVSCGADSVLSQDDTRTPESRNSRVKAMLPDASGKKWGDTDTDSKKCVTGGEKAKTSVRGGWLSFEQTPNQPQGSLVPESDSDSDGGRDGGVNRRQKTRVSDSDSHKSSPNSSAFLSPPNKIVPESEDESSLTPSSSTGLNTRVSFSSEKPDVAVQKNKSPACVDNSEEEITAQGGTNSRESVQHVKQKSNLSFTGEDGLVLTTPEVSRDAIPEFNMDSDTDVEGEEEEAAPARTLSLNTSQQADQPPNAVQFHMDSDTDLDEDEVISDKAPKTVPFSNDTTKPSSGIQPEGIIMNSDTDVDDDDDAVSEAVTTAKASSFQVAPTADSAPSAQPRDVHIDSDTDVDEEDEGGKNKNSQTDETLIKSEVYPVVPESPAAPHCLHPNTDTSDAAVSSHVVGDPSVASVLTESCATRAAGADLDILSDSDTDVEGDSLLVIPPAVTNTSVFSGKTSGALKSDSEADTDVDEPCVPPGDSPADLRVEDEEGDTGEMGEDKIPHLLGEHTSSAVPPLQKCSTPIQASENELEDMETQAFTSPSSGAFTRAEASSLKPAVLSSCSDSQADEDYAVAETQSFVLQTRDPQTGEDPNPAFVRASKPADQSSRGDSFQLGLSDSSHLQCHDGALGMENTQYYVSEEGGGNLEETQAFEAISAAERTFAESDTNLEATQAYGEDEEPVRDTKMSEKEACVNLAFEATQAYISEPCNDAAEDLDKEKRQNTAVIETTDPTGLLSSLAIAETQPVTSFEEDVSLEMDNPICSAQHVKPGVKNKMVARESARPQEKHIPETESVAETQPMCMSDNEESEDEYLSKQLRLEEERTQPTCSALSLAETQPMHISADETQPLVLCELDDEDSVPLPRKRKAKQLRTEEKSQQLRNSDVHLAETQPVVASEDDDEDDSMPGPRKRKAKPLQLEDETQSQVNFEVHAVESQPSATGEGEQSDEEDTVSRKRKAKPLQLEEEQTQPLNRSEVSCDEDDSEVLVCPQKRKAKQLHLEDEESQQLMSSELSVAETQPACEDEEVDKRTSSQIRETKSLQHEETPPNEVSDVETQANEGDKKPEDDLIPQKRLAKQHHLEEEEMEPFRSSADSPGETPMKTKTEGTNEPNVPNSRQTRARLKEEVEEEAECSPPPKRKTIKERKTPQTTRGRRGKATTHDNNSEEEVKQQPKQTRGRKNTRQQEGEKDKGNVSDENLLMEQQEGKLKEEMDIAGLRPQQKEETKNDRMRTDKRTRGQVKVEREQRREELQNKGKANKEQERLQVNSTEMEKVEREEKNQLERKTRDKFDEGLLLAKKEQEDGLEREKKEQEHQTKLEKLRKEKEAKEKHGKVPQKNKDEEEKLKVPARGRRATRKTAQCVAEQEQNSSIPTSEDIPARRTRSHSNSSNSVSSERSASGVGPRASNGRGRGRGAKRNSETLQTTAVRSSRRSTTVAAGLTERDRSNSSSSISSAISSCSGASQNRGRGRKTRSVPHVVVGPDVSDQKSTVKGRKSGKTVESTPEVQHQNDTVKEETWRAATNRGQQQVGANKSEPVVSNGEGQSGQEKGPSSKRNIRVRGQKVEKTENVDGPVALFSSDGDEARNKSKGRRGESETNTKASGAKVSSGRNRVQKTTEEEGESGPKKKIPNSVQVRRTSRASSSQVKKNVKESLPDEEVEGGENMEVEAAEKKSRSWTPVVQRKKEEQPKEQDVNVAASEEPQTPASYADRKRRAPSDSSPLAKTPRSSSCSPAARVQLRAGSQAYKVLFTGVVDKEGEQVLASLGGSMAKGVADMNCLVTDKVRRTVKFLCAVAKGIPVVTTDWLKKSGKAGSFLSPNDFIVKDPEQEKKFTFCLQESLRTARSQPLLQGYEIHVTKSVKPEPVQMRDIISCSGATFLPKMPSSHKPQTVVISCEEDRRLCGPAVSASLPVVTSEFILTGILQQKVDFETHSLSSTPPSNTQPAGDRGRSRRKT